MKQTSEERRNKQINRLKRQREAHLVDQQAISNKIKEIDQILATL